MPWLEPWYHVSLWQYPVLSLFLLIGMTDSVVDSGKISKHELDFMLAGRAIFTLRSVETQTRYTYKIKNVMGKDKMWFVSVLRGQDNTTDYLYIGTLFQEMDGSFHFKLTAASKLRSDDKRVLAFTFTLNKLLKGTPDPRVEIWHEGRCGRCGRLLTVPESIASGFGPECLTQIKFRF
jgi:hypothetical protein